MIKTWEIIILLICYKVALPFQKDSITIKSNSFFRSAVYFTFADNTFLMYDADTDKYLHVDAAQIVDLADSVDDEAFDAGTF